MNRFVIQSNIERYNTLLKHETDASRRRVISTLLEEERGKLREQVKPEAAIDVAGGPKSSRV